MKLLLDTQALILAGRDQLPRAAEAAILGRSNEAYFSTASLWEMGIKSSLGKLEFKRDLLEYRDVLVDEAGFLQLDIELEQIVRAVTLPLHHKDPFDRLLIGQALTDDLVIVGSDEIFDRYGCSRIWK